MGSIPGGDENFLSEHPQKYKQYKFLRGAGKPSTYFKGSGTYVSKCGVTRNKKKYYFIGGGTPTANLARVTQ
jgi:hypothetical protein